ncbi:MAG: O-antigen ligase family protein [Candidatus Magasanikiibacteriota bacterium]
MLEIFFKKLKREFFEKKLIFRYNVFMKQITTNSLLWYIGLPLAVLILIFFIVWQGVNSLVLFLLFILLWGLSYRLDIGLYILVFLAPMMHWVIYLENYNFIRNNFSYLTGVYAPAVDFWALFLGLAFVWWYIREFFRGETFKIYLPGVGFFILFLISALASLSNLSIFEISSGLKYIVRFLIFIYLVYLALGINIIRHDKKKFLIALKVYASVGFLGALMGFTSFFLGEWTFYALGRAVPFPIFGWAPFGDQHIFLAEIMVVTLPVYFYLWYIEVNNKKKKLLASLGIFVGIISLLTLSRAAWLTILLEIIIFYLFTRSFISWKEILKKIKWLMVVVVLLAGYFGIFMTTLYVERSTEARWALTDISLHLFYEHPILGQGVGSFIDRLSEVKYFMWEFGDPIDAHSIISKLLAEQGLLGLLTFGLFIAWVINNILERYHDKKYTPEAQLAALLGLFLVVSPLIFQMFNTQYYSAKMWVPIMLGMAQLIVYFEGKRFPYDFNFIERK